MIVYEWYGTDRKVTETIQNKFIILRKKNCYRWRCYTRAIFIENFYDKFIVKDLRKQFSFTTQNILKISYCEVHIFTCD